MKNYKIIISGPVGAGKSTAVRALSDIDVVDTDEIASDETKIMKANTTVAMDYGVLNISDNERVHLYGTPGQERFDFMWDILSQGGLGLVLLVSNAYPDPFDDIRSFLQAFGEFIGKTSVVIGITKTDEKASPSIDDYHTELGDLIRQIPVFEVDARDRVDLVMLVEALLLSLEPE
jgi:signal recognition particle receptor subunit beta